MKYGLLLSFVILVSCAGQQHVTSRDGVAHVDAFPVSFQVPEGWEAPFYSKHNSLYEKEGRIAAEKFPMIGVIPQDAGGGYLLVYVTLREDALVECKRSRTSSLFCGRKGPMTIWQTRYQKPNRVWRTARVLSDDFAAIVIGVWAEEYHAENALAQDALVRTLRLERMAQKD